MCYLIDVMGMPKEVAKALIIDSAAAWDYKTMSENNKFIMGYGIVPIDIRKIVETESDEIRFVVYGTSDSYRTANYAIPVPKDDDNKYPYIARATLCYFPKCSRTQGVDYTDRELSLKFGRIINDKGKSMILMTMYRMMTGGWTRGSQGKNSVNGTIQSSYLE